VFLPVFLKRAASHGIVPQSQGDVDQMLKIAAMVQAHTQAATEKAASSRSGLIKLAADRLEQLTYGGPAVPQVTAADVAGFAGDQAVAQALGSLAKSK